MPARKLWSRSLCDGEKVEATLWHDRELHEATVELSVFAAHGEDTLAVRIADAIKNAIDGRESKWK
jgi:hypothetical protein